MSISQKSIRITDGIDFGPLTGLIGNWQGSNGVNLVALPDQKGSFTLLITPYSENFNVNAVSATTPNRGLQMIQQMPTLSYNTAVFGISDPSNPELIHVENGFWETILDAANNGFGIFRLANIPHGNSLVAQGNAVISDGPPEFDLTLSAIPVGNLPVSNGQFLPGYTDDYIGTPVVPGFLPTSPNSYLKDYLQNQINNGMTVTSTITIKVSSQNQGGVESISELNINTRVPKFDATFWIESMTDADGNAFTQLQYSQCTLIEFPINGNMPGQTVIWPHINVNTMTLTT